MAGPFQPKTWFDSPSTLTPLSAAGLNDLETRANTQLASLGTDGLVGGQSGSPLTTMTIGQLEVLGHSYTTTGPYDYTFGSKFGGLLGCNDVLVYGLGGSLLYMDSNGSGPPVNSGWQDCFRGILRRKERVASVFNGMGGPYVAAAGATLLCYGVNDMSQMQVNGIGETASRALQIWQNAVRAILARARCAVVFPHNDAFIVYTGSWNHAAGNWWQNSIGTYSINTGTGTATFWVPGDYEGGTNRFIHLFLVATGTAGQGGVSTITKPDNTTFTIDTTSNTQADTSQSPVRGTPVVAKVSGIIGAPRAVLTAAHTNADVGSWALDSPWSQTLPANCQSTGFAQISPPSCEIVHYSAISSTTITIDGRAQLGTAAAATNAHQQAISVMQPIKIASPAAANGLVLDSVGIEAVVPQPVIFLGIAKMNPWAAFWPIANADVATWNTTAQTECTAYADGLVQYADTDTALGGGGTVVNPSAIPNFAIDGAHPSSVGHGILAAQAFTAHRTAMANLSSANRAQMARRCNRRVMCRVSRTTTFDTVALGTTMVWDTIDFDEPFFQPTAAGGAAATIGPGGGQGSLLSDLKTLLITVPGYYRLDTVIPWNPGATDTVATAPGNLSIDGIRQAQIMINGIQAGFHQQRATNSIFVYTWNLITIPNIYLGKYDKITVVATSSAADNANKVVQGGGASFQQTIDSRTVQIPYLSIERISG